MAKAVDEILSSVMKNEELMNKIKDTVKGGDGDSSTLESVISLITPFAEDKNEDTDKKDTVNSKDVIEADLQNTQGKASIISSLGEMISRNAPLLCALKPYLSKEKCQLIDNILRISKISGVLDLI